MTYIKIADLHCINKMSVFLFLDYDPNRELSFSVVYKGQVIKNTPSFLSAILAFCDVYIIERNPKGIPYAANEPCTFADVQLNATFRVCNTLFTKINPTAARCIFKPFDQVELDFTNDYPVDGTYS